MRIRLIFVRKVVYLVLVFQLISCNLRTYKLLDDRTKVPIDTNVFKNISKFNYSLLNTIDTSVVYEEFDRRYNALARLDNHIENNFYRTYKFYSNGRINFFSIDKDNSLLKELDPLYSGYRGVYYIENNIVRFDLFAGIDERQHLGKLPATLTFNGDTMYVKRDDLSYTKIYIKRKLPKEYFMYKSDW